MTRFAFLLLTVVAGAACAHREPARSEAHRAPLAAAAHADWVKLGDRSVDGARDHDVISVGRREGSFRKIMIAVARSPIELHDVVVNFNDGTSFSPQTRLVFGANSRSGVIDLPGTDRVIRNVEFKYGNLPGDNHAEVELWGR